MIYKILLLLVAVAALGYLFWWWRRFAAARRARQLAGQAPRRDTWPPDFLEQLLEYARLLDPLSPAMAGVCLGLAKRGIDDPRARALCTRFLAAQRLTPESAPIARHLARLTPAEPVGAERAAEVGNAAALLDQLLARGLATDQDLLQRATLARLWVDVAPPALAAGYKAWRLLRGTPEAEPLLRFLFDCLVAMEEPGQPETAADQARALPAEVAAAEIYCAMADLPPADLALRRRAIASTFACADYTACCEQCQRTRDEFGAPALSDDIWRMWGRAVVQLAARDWPAFEQGTSSHLPAGATWARLQEVLDHACALAPDDRDLLRAQAWTYLQTRTPIARAQAVYERVLAQRLPIAPALERLAEHAHETGAWGQLEAAGRALLPLQAGERAARTRHWLAEAIVEGGLALDAAILAQVFDEDPAYAGLNACLARHYLELPALTADDLVRIARLLDSLLPPTLDAAAVQTLRERYALAVLDSGAPTPDAFKAHVGHYLEAGGAHERLMRWAVDAGLGDQGRKLALLESLVRQRPADRAHCLALADLYAASGAPAEQMQLLAQAAEDGWRERPRFDGDDCRLAAFLGQHTALAPWARRRLLEALLHDQPAGWRELAGHYLAQTLQEGQADAELLQLVVDQLYRPGQRDPLHVWALEALSAQRDAPVADGLRLLALYDAGVARPGEGAADAARKAPALAEALAARGRSDAGLRALLFVPLLNRLIVRAASALAPWEVELFFSGLQDGLLPQSAVAAGFAAQLAAALAAAGDGRAVAVQRWAYEHGGHKPADAAQLFAIAEPRGQVAAGDPFWFGVARRARGVAEASAASDYLVEELLRRDKWGQEEIEVAVALLEPPYRERLAGAFVGRVEYGRDRKLDQALLDLLDEAPALGAGRAELLLALAERREKKHDDDGALEACFLIEASVGGSEGLTQRIVGLLPNSPARAQYAGRLADYLQRYPNSFALLAQMVTLARDPAKPLSFELAFAIVDRWGDVAARQDAAQAGYAGDPSFVTAVKCEVYDLYHGQLTPQDEQTILRSIGKHSRQALNAEARGRIERIGDEVLSSSGQDNAVRQAVAELLYGLGNLPAATWHLEQLADVPDYHQVAVEALERIARQLESPRRELPALLAAYRCMAHDAYQRGNVDAAEATAQKAKAILMDEAAAESLTEEGRKRLAAERDPILKLHQTILEARREAGKPTPEQTRDLADIYRLRGLWDKAGRLYSDLALALQRSGNRTGALECAEALFDCYYKAGKGWWDPAGRYLLRILWGYETPPSIEAADEFNARERRLMESVAVLYHSLYVDPNLTLAQVQRSRYRRDALALYERLPFDYVQERDYVRRLMFDLRQAEPTILEPFELVPHIREHGRAELWTGTRYERLDRLGAGAFAEVFKVMDTQSGQVYAMKLITPATGRDAKALERFQREGVWLRELDHPNIVKCYDAGVQEDRQYIIMDYVDGQTLDDLITRRRREIPLEVRLRIFLSICSAAEYLHDQGILHRDLHPGNVLVGGADLDVVKLTDFGLATMMDREGVGKSSRINGRENYIPPEVFARRSETAASEVYSLGAMLCFIVSGWPHPDAALLRELKSPEYLGLGEVIERALANDPAARHQRVTELIQDLCRRSGVHYDYGAILQRVTPLRFQQMFELGREIGRGEAGIVYRARDLRTPGAPDVAIKEIASDRVRGSLERRAEQFYRVRDLAHPNLVQLQAFFCVDTKLYVVMEWVEGQSLADVMDAGEAQGKRFLPAESLRLLSDVARGLAFVHQHGIVHGCLVPTNVLVAKNGTTHARLSDFAASVLFEGDQWHKSALIRQYNYYLAPEIAQNERVTPASDVYSLGWLLCQVVTGQRGQLSSAEVFAALEEVGRWSEAQKEGIVEIIEGSTALDPARRAYADGAALLASLTRIGEEQTR